MNSCAFYLSNQRQPYWDARFTEHPSAVALSPNADQVAIGGLIQEQSQTYQVRAWKLSDTSKRESLSLVLDAGSGGTLSFNPDGQRLAVGGGSTVRIIKSGSGEEICSIPTRAASVHILIFSPKGDYLAAGCVDYTVRLWEANSGSEVARVAHEAPITEIGFEPRSGMLVTAGEDGKLCVWDYSSALQMQNPLPSATPPAGYERTAQE